MWRGCPAVTIGRREGSLCGDVWRVALRSEVGKSPELAAAVGGRSGRAVLKREWRVVPEDEWL